MSFSSFGFELAFHCSCCFYALVCIHSCSESKPSYQPIGSHWNHRHLPTEDSVPRFHGLLAFFHMRQNIGTNEVLRGVFLGRCGFVRRQHRLKREQIPENARQCHTTSLRGRPNSAIEFGSAPDRRPKLSKRALRSIRLQAPGAIPASSICYCRTSTKQK